MALSLYAAPDLPDKKDSSSARPILRKQLFGLTPESGDFVLIYLLNHGYAEQIIALEREANPPERSCIASTTSPARRQKNRRDSPRSPFTSWTK